MLVYWMETILLLFGTLLMLCMLSDAFHRRYRTRFGLEAPSELLLAGMASLLTGATMLGNELCAYPIVGFVGGLLWICVLLFLINKLRP